MIHRYVEAQSAPPTAPLALWTNGKYLPAGKGSPIAWLIDLDGPCPAGGPGCSGLFGALNENGPFRPNNDGKTVSVNELAWNKVAHILYVEIPVGVGFSYSTDNDEYKMGDIQTAADNYVVIQEFYKRFPHLRSHDFYLSSESYGGESLFSPLYYT